MPLMLLIPTDYENTILLQYSTVFLPYWLTPRLGCYRAEYRCNGKTGLGFEDHKQISRPYFWQKFVDIWKCVLLPDILPQWWGQFLVGNLAFPLRNCQRLWWIFIVMEYLAFLHLNIYSPNRNPLAFAWFVDTLLYPSWIFLVPGLIGKV